MEDASSTQAKVITGNRRQLSALHMSSIRLSTSPIELAAAPWLLITTVV
jgi:hypothetical protein